METYWFGYLWHPARFGFQGAARLSLHGAAHAVIIDWVIKQYGADPERVSCSAVDGRWGSTTLAFRHPELFAASIRIDRGTRQRALPSLAARSARNEVLMRTARPIIRNAWTCQVRPGHPGDLPFFGWCCAGRATALPPGRSRWTWSSPDAGRMDLPLLNNGDHSSGAQAMARRAEGLSAGEVCPNAPIRLLDSSLDNNPATAIPGRRPWKRHHLRFSLEGRRDEESKCLSASPLNWRRTS